MKKVYILVNDWVFDEEQDCKVNVYDSIEKADHAMRYDIDEWGRDNSSDDWDFNEGEHHASFYKQGRWKENHIAWTIYESEMEDHAEQPKTIGDVLSCGESLVQDIRNQVSNKLVDTDEQHPLEVHLSVSADPHNFDTIDFDKIYMMPGDGRIFLHLDGWNDDDISWCDFSNFYIDDQLSILKQLYNYD